MPLSFTNEPATVGEASRPLAAPFWAGSAPRTPPRADAVDADADADYISRGAGRSPSSLSPIPEETSGGKPTPAERRRLSPTYEAGTPPPEGMDGPDARKTLDNAIREGASIMVPSPEPDAEISRLTASPAKSDDMTDVTLTFVEGEDREKHVAPPPPSPLNAVLAFGGWRTVRPEPRRLVRMPAPPPRYYGRRRCALAAALAFVLCGAVPPPRPPPEPQKEGFPWVPVVVAGAGVVALARPEVRAGRALAALGRGVVIGAFPA